MRMPYIQLQYNYIYYVYLASALKKFTVVYFTRSICNNNHAIYILLNVIKCNEECNIMCCI